MSITSLAEEAIMRTDRKALGSTVVLRTRLAPVVAGLELEPGKTDQLMGALQDAGGENPIQKTTSSNVLDALVKYIPTESVTLYLAATAALSSLTQAFPVLTADRLYWTFVVLIPILLALIYFAKAAQPEIAVHAGESQPVSVVEAVRIDCCICGVGARGFRHWPRPTQARLRRPSARCSPRRLLAGSALWLSLSRKMAPRPEQAYPG
jgi:hypothetical protein